VIEEEPDGVYVTGGPARVCDSCDLEAHGYADHELMQAPHGWVWHPIPFRDNEYFVMCGECENTYAARRAESKPWAA
jgi:hypothetical protein